jgi:hypothetical protein
MITSKKVFEKTDMLYDHLMEAYEIAGQLRDSFSGIGGENESELKEHCNVIRGKIYSIRELRGKFKEEIHKIGEGTTT